MHLARLSHSCDTYNHWIKPSLQGRRHHPEILVSPPYYTIGNLTLHLRHANPKFMQPNSSTESLPNLLNLRTFYLPMAICSCFDLPILLPALVELLWKQWLSLFQPKPKPQAWVTNQSSGSVSHLVPEVLQTEYLLSALQFLYSSGGFQTTQQRWYVLELPWNRFPCYLRSADLKVNKQKIYELAAREVVVWETKSVLQKIESSIGGRQKSIHIYTASRQIQESQCRSPSPGDRGDSK